MSTERFPEPGSSPDLEPGGGVAPGATPPESPQTAGLSASEPRTRHNFPPTGGFALVLSVLLAVIFVAVIIALIVTLA
ncbi:hypothetical protein FOS14_07865 [Skermania sp. ID1734]|uniref:DUF6480 family protein n=1 Tax=Skermania sp. ID1734 TaxID=2597516 RepID=UPI00117C28B7|nr:DUF6480 family protein [Skermania sp. ID1734]TSE00335.1 hypothetical protein FOS14_07865 [Skermania sp. ID1734]